MKDKQKISAENKDVAQAPNGKQQQWKAVVKRTLFPWRNKEELQWTPVRVLYWDCIKCTASPQPLIKHNHCWSNNQIGLSSAARGNFNSTWKSYKNITWCFARINTCRIFNDSKFKKVFHSKEQRKRYIHKQKHGKDCNSMRIIRKIKNDLEMSLHKAKICICCVFYTIWAKVLERRTL